MKYKFCIIIPVHSPILNICEQLSLKRLVNVIKNKNYDVFFITPENLDLSEYKKIIDSELSSNDKFTFSRISFDKKYFQNSDAYNKFCIDYNFYKTFYDYKYIFMYQLDCYLFKDNIEEWCDKNYDFIGSPILSEYSGWKDNNDIIWVPKVGNGGFGLRKISTFMEITDPNGELMQYFKDIYGQPLYDLKKFNQEDKYFYNIFRYYWEANILSWKEACKFGLDMTPELLENYLGKIDINDIMGCHAWPKNIRFWKDKIPEITQEIIDYCEEKYKAYFLHYYGDNRRIWWSQKEIDELQKRS